VPESSNHLEDVGRWVGLLLEGELSPDDQSRLEQVLVHDDAALTYYESYVELHSLLHWQHGLTEKDAGGIPPQNVAGVTLAPQTTYPGIIFLGNPAPDLINHSFSGWPLAYLVATVVLAIALFVSAFVNVSQPVDVVRYDNSLPSRPAALPAVVGRITAAVDCVLGRAEGRGQGTEDISLPSSGNDRKAGRGRGAGAEGGEESDSLLSALHSPLVLLGDTLELRSGLLEITYDTGARVILQGPVTYEVESPTGGYLSVGKLTARLDSHSEISNLKSQISNHQSEIINHQFAVRTPTAVVTDLGTEFGVEVDKQGGTTSHVFRGSVRVQRLSARGTADTAGNVLHENESTRITRDSGEIVVVRNAKTNGFVRILPGRSIKTLDLADVVAGGDGFSNRRERGINSATGQIARAINEVGWLVGDGNYHPVPELPLVDGVFIPDGSRRHVQVTSAGHLFDDFEDAENRTCQHIWAGGAALIQSVPVKIGAIDYTAPDHNVIYLHACNGITFNLDAIRRANPGCRLLRFSATAANLENLTAAGKVTAASLWVLVDGRARFQRREVTAFTGAMPVNVPIADSDRFLTLAATNGKYGISRTWIVFGDPRLTMRTLEKNPEK
jgi:hypothetical protein